MRNPSQDGKPGTIDVWLWQVSDAPLAHEELTPLSPGEQQRAARFRIADHRARWVRSHAGMRRILAAYLGITAAQVHFRRDAHGKPRLDPTAGTATDIAFNLSHSEDWCGLAVVCGMEVGLDIQVPHIIDPRLWRRTLTPAERAEMEALAPEERDAAFFRGWTRKEALGKAEGRGVYAHLRSTEMGLGKQPGIFTIEANNGEGAILRWHLQDLPLTGNLFGAVASSLPAKILLKMQPSLPNFPADLR